MYQQQPQQPAGGPDPMGNFGPQGAPEGRLEPIGETWATGVGPVRLGSRSGKFRWGIALGVVLIVALVTVGGAFVLSGAGGSAKSLTAGNAPKSTLMFVDLRTDLPGDQHQKLADFMSHFPGFADRAQFDSAFDDILNRITSAISPDLNYSSAFKSWTTGELSVAITGLGAAGTLTPTLMSPIALPTDASGMPMMPSTSSTSVNGVVIVGLKDRSAGEAWVASEVAKTSVTFTAQDYAGTKLYVGPLAPDAPTAAYAFTDKVLLLGTVDAVKAGLDAPSKGSLADSAGYQKAMSSFSGDSVARFYLDSEALVSQELSSMSSIDGIAGMSAGMMLGTDYIPAWIAGSVRADSDHMTVEMTMPKTKAALSPGNSESVVASQLPGSTIGVLEVHSVGKFVNDELKAVSASSTAATVTDAIKQVQDAISKVGGIDWIGDADVVLTKTGSTYGGGLVVKTTDSATATTKMTMITNLVALAGIGGSGITQTDETYKGATITLVDASGAGLGLPATSLAIATKGDLLIAGYGDAFVKAVLDTTTADSLASQSVYQSVMAAAGKSNAEYGYFNISAVADEIGQTYSGSAASYNLNVKPYVDHIGGAAFASIDGSTVTLRFVVTAK